MLRAFGIIFVFFFLSHSVFSQGRFTVQNGQKSDKIKFKFINNLIVFPVKINGVELSFLLDTGVSKPIIFNILNVSDSLRIKNTESIYLRGLGEGESVEALKSSNNVFQIGDAINLNQDLYAVYDSNLNFAPRLGIPIHGIIGFDLLKDLVVEINYAHKYIRLTEPPQFKYKACKKCDRLNLEFYNNKPYLNATVTIDQKEIPVKLLIDSGGSDALWLFEDESLGIRSGEKFFNDFLGHGLSGSVYGKRSRVDAFTLKGYTLKNVNVAFPDSSSISYARRIKDRNGSISGNILKRFNVIIDYRRAIVTFKKNGYFKSKFTYNKSGIELAHDGLRLVRERDASINPVNGLERNENTNGTRIVLDTRYKLSLKPAFSIVELRAGSPAEKAGLKIGDQLLVINGKQAYQLSLQDIMEMFYADAGKRIRMRIDRDGVIMNLSFILENVFDKK
ncbi:aspartyl protease family protein [Aestuariivivens sediminicola]|uniref:aspartyl protease family protein n=1 Tax=Aestuariivivens sediminicola TaxID=2913560 RepID=UPI0024126EA5|nr:aspartyl protease family protein [Aestuariivivens sediminicola]